jgi:hypothetical protein
VFSVRCFATCKETPSITLLTEKHCNVQGIPRRCWFTGGVTTRPKLLGGLWIVIESMVTPCKSHQHFAYILNVQTWICHGIYHHFCHLPDFSKLKKKFETNPTRRSYYILNTPSVNCMGPKLWCHPQQTTMVLGWCWIWIGLVMSCNPSFDSMIFPSSKPQFILYVLISWIPHL